MKLDDLLRQTSEWMKGTGPRSEIVISSRIRLARNFSKIPFSEWSSKAQRKDVLTKAKGAIDGSTIIKDSSFFDIAKLGDVDRQFLIERHLMSLEHARDPESKALIIDPKEIISIMINEEDHLRIQVLQSGFNLLEAWRVVSSLDQELSKRLDYAYSSRWGYLTACPTNTGTGMRASVMLHLPALVLTKQAAKVLEAVAKLSLAIRGLYGEGTEARGNFFQISNQVSLGRREEEIIDSIERIINQVVARESNARHMLMTKDKFAVTDRIWRAYGTLQSAHIISSEETVKLLSVLRLGVDLGIIKNISINDINSLFILTQPAHLQKSEGRQLSPNERDVKRAELIRKKLKKEE
jgi:protein arginine kinase